VAAARFLVAFFVGFALVRVAAAQPTCPAPAAVDVFVNNESADPSVTVAVSGSLVASAATCAGGGNTTYTATLACTGAGVVRCGTIPNLRPGAWVNHLQVTVAGSGAQVQTRRAVFTGGGAENFFVWTIYPRTFVVAAANEQSLRDALAAATAFTATNAGQAALVTFAVGGTFDLPKDPTCVDGSACDPHECHAALCFTGSRVVVDALDATASPGAVALAVGTRALSVLRIYGEANVFRGLVFRGSQNSAPTVQMDTIDMTGAGARANHLEQSVVVGPTMGDAIGLDAAAGADGDDANVVDGCEVSGARDKGIKVTFGAHLVVERSCIHDNRNGGVQSTLGGHVTAIENVIQHNVPGSGNGLYARGNNPDEPTTLSTSANIVRFAGGRGLSVTDNAVATFGDDYVADNGFVGTRVETTETGTAGPKADFHGVAFVCNHAGNVSGTCLPQGDDDSTPCIPGNDADCCDSPTGCCVEDPNCAAPLRCGASSPSHGFGGVLAQVDGKPGPAVSFGKATPGRNAFAWNREAGVGANFFLNIPFLTVPAVGNQWEHCGTGTTCDAASVTTLDVRVATGAKLSLGTSPGPRANAPVVTRVSPVRPRQGELVRVFGDNFNAVDGTTCAAETAPADPCSADNVAVADKNKASNANRVRLFDTAKQQVSQNLYPDAVTPTMLAFRMPFDCYAPLVLEVAKRDPLGFRPTATIDLCDRAGCAGQPAGVACDDGDPCTTDDRCTGGEQGTCRGTRATCDGPCETGVCDPVTGCVRKPTGTSCDDGDACTVGDHCAADGACHSGNAATCTGPCLTGTCDPAHGCVPRPATTTCDDDNVCTIGDHCGGTDGRCVPGPPRTCEGPCMRTVCDPTAGCLLRPATAPCDDGDACTVGDHCSGDANVCVRGTPRDCTGPCLTGACDSGTGCVPGPAGTACDDGDPCTAGDQCVDGACVAGARRSCEDDNPCTDDGCTADGGCAHTPNASPCDDGDPCTDADTCRAGICAGSPRQGFDRAHCKLAELQTGALCAPDADDPKLDQLIGARIAAADALLQRAAAATRVGRRKALARKSDAALRRVPVLASRFLRHGRITAGCAARIKAAIGARRDLIAGLIV